MKKQIILVVLAILFQTGFICAAKPAFLIKFSESCDTKDTYVAASLQWFEVRIANEIKRKLPCADVYMYSGIQDLLGFNRTQQLMGLGDEAMTDFSGALGVNYLIILTAEHMNSIIQLKATCFYLKKTEVVAEAIRYGSAADYTAVGNAVTNDFIKGLIECEICPYTGPVVIEVKSDRDETETFYVSSPCGGDNARVTASRKADMTLKWDLNKLAVLKSDGSVKYDLYEKYTTVTSFPCYKCRNGDQGPVTITETNETEAKAEGLSSKSVFEGNKVKDVIISIVFFENGTYSILVKATSKEGLQKDSKEKKVEGMCESESEPKSTRERRIDVPIEVTLGPYKGTAEDKVLQQKETKDLSQGKEKTTMTIDFTLTRKE